MVKTKGGGNVEFERPYFMTNKEWYYYDESDECYKLTDKAPPEAVKSYEEFQEELEKSIIYPDLR